jgi:hypothetical protein
MLPITGEITKPITYEITSTDGAPIPALDLNFITSAFPSTITFTRASDATYFDSTGTLQTAGNDVARLDYNPVTLAARGLLIEEQRTNLLTYSAEFDNAAWTKQSATITANAANSPAGTVTADKLIPDNTVAGAYAILSVPITSGVTYTYSVFAKADEFTELRLLGQLSGFGSGTTNQTGVYNLSTGVASVGNGTPTVSMVAVGNGWYRCILTVAATATTTDGVQIRINTTGNGTSGLLIWGAQMEAGAFPTSYIPTTAAAATRNADAASMTGTNFSSWYNAAEGTLYGEFSAYNTSATRLLVQMDDTGFNNRIFAFVQSNNGIQTNVVVSGSSVAQLFPAGTYTSPAVGKVAQAYATNNFASCFNAGVVSTDTSGTVPTVTQTRLGFDGSSAYLNGYIRRIAYYPRRLSNAELQSITS